MVLWSFGVLHSNINNLDKENRSYQTNEQDFDDVITIQINADSTLLNRPFTAQHTVTSNRQSRCCYCWCHYCCLPESKRRPDRTSNAWWWFGLRHSWVSSRWTEPWVSGSTGSSRALASCEHETTVTPAKPCHCKSPIIPCSSTWHLLWWSGIATGPWCPWRGCPKRRRKQSAPPLFP